MKQKKSDALARCLDKARRQNLKQKRKRNLIKKAIELTRKLDMDIHMVLKDRDTNRLSQYSSGDQIRGHFTLEQAIKDLKETKDTGRKKVRLYDDDDYQKLNATQDAVDNDVLPPETIKEDPEPVEQQQ